MPYQITTITAQNTFTDALTVRPGDLVSISVTGSFDALVTLQRQTQGIVAYRDIPNPDGSYGFMAPTELTYEVDESGFLRLGVKTGDYTSGTIICRLGKG